MRSLFLAAAFVLAIARPAGAGFPPVDPTNCEIPAHVNVVGSDGGSADPFGTFTVIIRDLTNAPVANSVVTISFAGCPHIQICPTQLDPHIVAVNCAGKAVTGVTNALGVTTFTVIGASSTAPCYEPPPVSRAEVRADGNLIGNMTVSALDVNAVPGLDASDLAAWLSAFFCGGTQRLDYDGDGSASATDLSLWLGAFFHARSTAGCSVAPCP